MGKTQKKLMKERYKQDALEYYDIDIDWFAFIFVMMQLHALEIVFFLTGVYVPSDDASIAVQVTILAALMGTRGVQLVFLSEIKGQDRTVKRHDYKLWIILFVFNALITTYCLSVKVDKFI